MTDENISQTIEVTNYQGYKYKFMPVNLGWCDGYYSKTYAERSCKVKFTAGNASKEVIIKQIPDTLSTQGNHPYYQWGRKDPFLPASDNKLESYDISKHWYDKDGRMHTEQVEVGDFNYEDNYFIKAYILNPNVMQSREENYGGVEQYTNLWSANNDLHVATDNPVVKTIYDPSPVGFKLPPGNAFTGSRSDGGKDYYATTNGTWDYFLRGLHIYTDSSKTKTIFFPAGGERIGDDGDVLEPGQYGCLHTADTEDYMKHGADATCCVTFRYFNIRQVNPTSPLSRTSGFGVRPIHE